MKTHRSAVSVLSSPVQVISFVLVASLHKTYSQNSLMDILKLVFGMLFMFV